MCQSTLDECYLVIYRAISTVRTKIVEGDRVLEDLVSPILANIVRVHFL